jgi:hypothetical protein
MTQIDTKCRETSGYEVPVLGYGVSWGHDAVVALWEMVNFLELEPAAGFEVANPTSIPLF